MIYCKQPKGYFRKVSTLVALTAEALHHAHQSGVIHRDIKPTNILLTANDNPKVSDFGLAKVENALSLSRTGDFASTPYYMSPEQAMTRRMGIDHRTDIYSLGVTFYEMLTLERPFQGKSSHDIFKKIMIDEPKQPHKINSRVPRDLSAVCLKAMEKDPGSRYATMLEFAQDLRRFLRGDVTKAKPVGTTRRTWKIVKRRKREFIPWCFVLTAICIIFFFIQENRPFDTTESAYESFLKIQEELDKLLINWENLIEKKPVDIDGLWPKYEALINIKFNLRELSKELSHKPKEISSSLIERIEKENGHYRALCDFYKEINSNKINLTNIDLTKFKLDYLKHLSKNLNSINEKLPDPHRSICLELSNKTQDRITSLENDQDLQEIWASVTDIKNNSNKFLGNTKKLRENLTALSQLREKIPNDNTLKNNEINSVYSYLNEHLELTNKFEDNYKKFLDGKHLFKKNKNKLMEYKTSFEPYTKKYIDDIPPVVYDAFLSDFDWIIFRIDKIASARDSINKIKAGILELPGKKVKINSSLDQLKLILDFVPDELEPEHMKLKESLEGLLKCIETSNEMITRMELEVGPIKSNKETLEVYQTNLDDIEKHITKELHPRYYKMKETVTFKLKSIDSSIKYVTNAISDKKSIKDDKERLEIVKKEVNDCMDFLPKEVKSECRKFLNWINNRSISLMALRAINTSSEKIKDLEAARKTIEDYLSLLKEEIDDRAFSKLEEIEEILMIQGLGFTFMGLYEDLENATLPCYRHNATQLAFVRLPGHDEFWMGASENKAHSENEKPRHKAEIAPFLICRTEVTQEAWQKIMGTLSEKSKPDHPVTNVTWNDCIDFCKKTGLRLPSESEWEYACSAGSERNNDWNSDSSMLDYANYLHCFKKGTDRVGQKRFNAFGLYDMHGNAWEWCQDRWHNNYDKAPSDGSAWESGNISDRVYRGGGFGSTTGCRSTNRARGNPERKSNSVGFRPACTIPATHSS